MTKESLQILEILKRDIIKQIQYDNIKIVRMEDKLKEIEKKYLTLKVHNEKPILRPYFKPCAHYYWYSKAFPKLHCCYVAIVDNICLFK